MPDFFQAIQFCFMGYNTLFKILRTLFGPEPRTSILALQNPFNMLQKFGRNFHCCSLTRAVMLSSPRISLASKNSELLPSGVILIQSVRKQPRYFVGQWPTNYLQNEFQYWANHNRAVTFVCLLALTSFIFLHHHLSFPKFSLLLCSCHRYCKDFISQDVSRRFERK